MQEDNFAQFEEILYAIGHITNSIEHCIESKSKLEIIIALRKNRTKLAKTIFDFEHKDGLKDKEESIWCTFKHLSASLIHLSECIEKSKSEEQSQIYRECFFSLKSVVKILYLSPELIEGKECERCKEDLNGKSNEYDKEEGNKKI